VLNGNLNLSPWKGSVDKDFVYKTTKRGLIANRVEAWIHSNPNKFCLFVLHSLRQQGKTVFFPPQGFATEKLCTTDSPMKTARLWVVMTKRALACMRYPFCSSRRRESMLPILQIGQKIVWSLLTKLNSWDKRNIFQIGAMRSTGSSASIFHLLFTLTLCVLRRENLFVLGKRVKLLLNNLVTGSENLPSRRTSDVDVLNGTVSAGARG